MVFRFARTGLGNRKTVPTISVTGNTFNAANEMTAFNGTPQTYDANGNLANDGTNTYSWDARNHLTAIVGPNTASFVYGPDGRRTQKAINGTSTQFLYDGLNPVQEIQNGALSANLITGLGIDEYFQRTDSAGARNYVTDILGSTLALTDSSGTTQTSYTYDPFGNTAATGQASSNPYQFTGRENDGTGLDYYRARYYDPRIARFISQDPMMFGPRVGNLYAYVQNNPSSRIDPEGKEDPECEEIRQALAWFYGDLAAAKKEPIPSIPDVRSDQEFICDLEERYDELGCGDDGPDGGGRPLPESCPLDEPYKKAAAPSPSQVLSELILLGILLGGSPVGI